MSDKLPWITQIGLVYIGVIGAAIMVIAGVFVWKYMIPQLIAYNNYRVYMHASLVKSDLSSITKRLIRLENLIKEIRDAQIH